VARPVAQASAAPAAMITRTTRTRRPEAISLPEILAGGPSRLMIAAIVGADSRAPGAANPRNATIHDRTANNSQQCAA